jgi:cyclic-di-GMP phosphodiesterase TipF (flagellum assembly factor)
MAATIRSAIDANRVDLYLQPMVTLPQRKIRYYEALSRLRSDKGDVVLATDFLGSADAHALMPKIDNLVTFRCVQLVRRLLLKNRDIGLFWNLSVKTLTDPTYFPQLLEFLAANRAIAPSLVLQFTHTAVTAMGAAEHEGLAAASERGFHFSMDHLTSLRLDPPSLPTAVSVTSKLHASLLLKGLVPLRPTPLRPSYPIGWDVSASISSSILEDERSVMDRVAVSRSIRTGLAVLPATAGAPGSATGAARSSRRARRRAERRSEGGNAAACCGARCRSFPLRNRNRGAQCGGADRAWRGGKRLRAPDRTAITRVPVI